MNVVVSFGFELHTIRGMDKMKLRCDLALCVMLAMALRRIQEKQIEKCEVWWGKVPTLIIKSLMRACSLKIKWMR
jgi:hypothetical protein